MALVAVAGAYLVDEKFRRLVGVTHDRGRGHGDYRVAVQRHHHVMPRVSQEMGRLARDHRLIKQAFFNRHQEIVVILSEVPDRDLISAGGWARRWQFLLGLRDELWQHVGEEHGHTGHEQGQDDAVFKRDPEQASLLGGCHAGGSDGDRNALE